ncbi:MAG: erythronate-4-phosphate dehydrogenase [Granulosicoccus sp.]|jgi:erythronate-4-phosphate dehydrogenase
MKILGDSQILLFEELFSSLGQTAIYSGRNLSAAELEGVDALITRSTLNVDQALLNGSSVKFVGTCTIGTDHLDLDYLQSQSIRWTNAAACNANAVVQYVLSAMAQLAPEWMQSTVGIIGCGNVGGRVYRRLKALGVNCHVYDPFLSAQDNPDLVSLDDLLQADIITSHAPLTTTGEFPTYHLVGEHELSQLRPNALLISAGRGAVIDNQALLNRLIQKKDICVVLDVWDNEPDISAELLSLVDIATPHIAGHSLEGKEQGTVMVFQQLCDSIGVTPSVDVSTIVNTETAFLPELRPKIVPRIEPKIEPKIVPAITLEESASSVAILNAVLLAAYPIMEDDARLREWKSSGQAMAVYFDRMRKEYPVRREYSHFIFPDVAQCSPIADWLALLGAKQ